MGNEPTGDLILVVDDIPDNIEVLVRILERARYQVEVVHNGHVALEMAVNLKPAMIMLDVMMPNGPDGFEICEMLKQTPQTADIPIIFVTALTDTQFIVRGLEVGAVDVITKPFRAKEVMARVNTHLTVQRQKEEIAALREQERLYFKKLSDMKDDVMQMTSHDLKNPIHNILTAVSLIRKHAKVDDQRGEELLATIEASSYQMRELVEGILDLARMETGFALKLVQIDLVRFLKHAFSAFELASQQKAISLTFNPPKSSIPITIDPERMEQVLHNLLSNAIKYTNKGGTVELTAQVHTDHYVIEVKDNGIGIPEADIPHVFEKFYRVSTVDALRVEGTGLGLAIVRTIVEKHEGRIHVTSKLNEGSTFSVILPC